MADQHTGLVTGGSQGIGRAIVERLAADGLRIVSLDRQPPPAPVDGETFIEVDLSQPQATAQALAQVTQRFDVSVLVNNVGTVQPAPLEDVTLEDLDKVVSLNLRCTIQCAQALLPGMKARRYGRIVSISSRAALGKELRTVYAATKAGLHGITRTWALELGRHGITVNAIGPGPIATELFERVNPADSPRTRAIIEGVPVGRLGTPADIAHAVALFADPRAGFITGQVLYVCGGMTAGVAPA
ncbi:MAG: SDR family oxidoreductase [Burkholderiales bacterium]|jgi:NAD(P)-dependent dehydrogenase (short-subunit alcohol dehydrogenase family)|nr:SDR family oxidoreductase [Burkholderiales bacterium]